MSRLLPGSQLNARISAVVAAGAVVVAAGVALLLANTIGLRNDVSSSQRAQAYLLSVANLERLVVDAETGLRGDVITAQASFLQPLYHAQIVMPSAIAAVERAAAQERAYQQQSEDLIAAVRSYMSGYVHRTLSMAAVDIRSARTLAVTAEGKRLVDLIRGRVAELERLLSRSQARRESSARHTASRSILDAIVVLVLLTVLTLVLGSYLGRLVVARERAKARSDATTETLQQSILPAALPEIPGCQVATRFIPGVGDVSGDFYDVLQVGEGEWALIIGDVCGKGAVAAATTAMARWTLRSSLVQGASPEEAMRFLNDVALGHVADGQFITAACIKLTREADQMHVVLACAGHPAPILVPRVGPPVTVDADGNLLGILPAIRVRTAELQLGPGDSLVAYTDGVTDQGPELRRSPEDALADRAEGFDAQELAHLLENLATHPAGPHPDDIAIVALRFVGGDAAGAPAAMASASGAV